MADWRHQHPVRRSNESGDFSRYRKNGSLQTKILVAIALGVLGLAFGAVSYMTKSLWEGQTKATKENTDRSIANTQEVKLVGKDVELLSKDVVYLKEGIKTLASGQQKIIDTLYQLPTERRASEKPTIEPPLETPPPGDQIQ